MVNIVEGRVIVTCPRRIFVTLRLETEDGAHGLGDATLNGRELAVSSCLSDQVLPALIGRDARSIEAIWQYLYKGAYWRRGPVTMTAILAVDMALWDLAGKRLGVPVHQLLGGRSRAKVPAYGHANGETIEDTVEAVSRYRNLGYRAVRAQCGVPGLSKVYGIARGEMHYEPAELGVAAEREWSTEHYLDMVPELFDRLRREFGYELHPLHDGHHRMTPTEAGWLGQRLEHFQVFWLQGPTPAENQELIRQLRSQTTTPLAVGKVFNSVFDLHTLVTERLVDYVRTTVVHAGGISGARNIASLMEPYQLRLGSDGATDLSPVYMAAALQVNLSVKSFGIQEYTRHSERSHAVFPHEYRFVDGALDPGSAPAWSGNR